MSAVTAGPEFIRETVSMSDAIDAVRAAFVDLARGQFEMPLRTSLRDGQFLIMSAHHRPSASAMVKTLSLNFSRTPAIVGSVVWSELGRAGQVIADAATVTMLRTGAVSGVATDLMARKDAKRLTLIGAGAQGADQVRAVCAVRDIESVTIVATSSVRSEGLAARLRDELPGVDFTTSLDADAAVGNADVVCCATTATQPLFHASSLPDRVHVNAIGAFRPTMRELPDELLGAATIVVDQRDAVLEESGEVIHALDTHSIAEDCLTELGTALLDTRAYDGPTVFKSVGVAIQDWAIARLLADRCFKT